MSTKLAVKIKRGRTVLVSKVMPDLDEAKRWWREGKSAQWIIEQSRKKPDDEE